MKRLSLSIALIVCFSVLSLVSAQEGSRRDRMREQMKEKQPPLPDCCVAHEDLSYIDDATQDDGRKLNLYMPKDAKDAPVIVYFPGGSWHVCERIGGRKVADFVVPMGIGVASVTYRTADKNDPKPEQMFPRFMTDAADAFAWVHSHIKDYGGNPDKLMLCGHSAGGHVAALLACDESYLKAHELDSGKAILGWIGFSGVYDLKTSRDMTIGDRQEEVMKRVFKTDDDSLTKASPLTYASKDDPAALLIYGETDTESLDVGAIAMAKALTSAGARATAHEAKGHGHDTSCRAQRGPDDPINALVQDFVLTCFGMEAPKANDAKQPIPADKSEEEEF